MTKEMKETLALILLFLVVTLFLFTPDKDKPSRYEERVVLPGETLWSIATEKDRVNTGKLVYQIEKINNVTSEIRPGMTLRIPVK